jgi:hypothetical protein
MDEMKKAESLATIDSQAKLLEQLATNEGCVEAAHSLWKIEVESAKATPPEQPRPATREAMDRRRRDGLTPAIERLAEQLPALIPAWIAMYIERIDAAARDQRIRVEAVRTQQDPPPIDMKRIIATHQLELALQVSGERIDPYIESLVDAMGTMDRDADEHLAAAVKFAGPAITECVPKLLSMLREHGLWHRPSQVGTALVRASGYDHEIVPTLRQMLADDSEQIRNAAISVLGMIGPAAQPAADQLLQFRNGTENERCGMIYAVARQGAPTREFLEVLTAAMHDDNGYVRRAAADALGELAVNAPRFVPLLIEACDFTEFLHDTSLPETAVAALGKYGPAAETALPRLRYFLEGPVKGRTVSPRLVREAIERITAGKQKTPWRPWSPQMRVEPVMEAEPLFPVTYQGKQCYIDSRGRIVIRTEFASGSAFSEGLAILRRRRADALVIDIKGREVFQSRWDEMGDYSDGLAAVRRGDKWGFVDRDGRVVVEPQYDSVTNFSEGLAGIEVGRRTEQRFRRSVTRTRPGTRGFINRHGEVVIAPSWADAYPFREGRALVCTGATMEPAPDFLGGGEMLSDRTYGYIDTRGQLLIPGKYSWAKPYSHGRAAVGTGHSAGRERHGYIDLEGNEVIPLEFTSATSFQDGLALVRRRGRKNRQAIVVIDLNGNPILELPYRHVEPFSEGLAPAFQGELSGYLGKDGRWAIEPQFDQASAFSNGLASVQRGEWFGWINQSGTFVWGPTTEGIDAAPLRSAWLT